MAIAPLLNVLQFVIMVVSVICWVLVLIRQFKSGVLHGVLGIVFCGLYSFIWGWVYNRREGITGTMLAWTACVVVNLIIGVGAVVAGAAAAAARG